jgi:hypothetical protein
MKYNFILDTNAYRQIALGMYLSYIQPTASEMRKREKKIDSKSLMSIVVTMELLRHFEKDDPAFDNCYRALALQYFHCQTKNFGDEDNVIEYIPPLNEILTKLFFNQVSPVHLHYRRIIEITEYATHDLEPTAYLKDFKDIQIIRDQLLFERQGLKENFEQFIGSFNNGIVDWNYFRTNETLRTDLLKKIRSGTILDLFAQGLLLRAHQVMGYNETIEDAKQKVPGMFKAFLPFFQLNSISFEKLLNGAPSLGDIQNKIWNAFNDMQILAAACYQHYRKKDPDTCVILVSDDSELAKACRGTYLEDYVWRRNKYISFIYNN